MKTAYFNRFEINMPDEAIDDCHHSGECLYDVQAWLPDIDLSHISDNDLKEELYDYGAWTDEELQDRTTNEERILWIAAGNIQEEGR